jgi:hypothetical protein
MEINEKEILRYLGYGRNAADDVVMGMVHDCISVVREAANPKSVSARFPLVLSDDNFIEVAGIRVQSKSLTKNLKDCSEVIFFAATLGTDVDRMLNRYLKLNIAKAAVFQATAAAAIEGYCNECQKKIEDEMQREGLFVRPRFSPGYGDLPLNIQGQFLEVLNTKKTIGVFLSEGDIMLPEKSVSAIMGLSTRNSRCVIEGCEACTNVGCAYRR